MDHLRKRGHALAFFLAEIAIADLQLFRYFFLVAAAEGFADDLFAGRAHLPEAFQEYLHSFIPQLQLLGQRKHIFSYRYIVHVFCYRLPASFFQLVEPFPAAYQQQEGLERAGELQAFAVGLPVDIGQGLLENIGGIVFRSAVGYNIVPDARRIFSIDLPDHQGVVAEQGLYIALIGMDND